MKTLIIVITSFLVASCTSESNKTEEVKTQNKNTAEIVPGLNATKYMSLYFSGQPSQENYAQLKKAGFSTIISLREDGEKAYNADDQRTAAEKSELTYVHIPMSGSEMLSDEMVQKITSSVVQYRRSGKILVHCGSGNRAALWAGGHFFRDHQFSSDEAINMAKKLGLTSPQLIENLENYLSQ